MSDDPLIREAGTGDVDALIDLRGAWSTERGAPADDTLPTRFAAWFERERAQRTFWLAMTRSGAPIGMVNLLTFERMPTAGRDSGRWGYLGNMYVRPEHRNRGVGRLLLGALVAHADAAALERIVLSPTERSVPFYRRAGFGAADQLLLRAGLGTSAPSTVVSRA